ncbi:MAG: hypothetical protein SAMD01599839_07700 [Rectinema sp.]
MRIQILGTPVAEYALDEATKVLTVAGLEVNLPDYERDTQNIVTISAGEAGPELGIEGKHGFIADIDIPPRRYVDEEGLNEAGDPVTNHVPVPLDTGRIILKLWPLPNQVVETEEEVQ